MSSSVEGFTDSVLNAIIHERHRRHTFMNDDDSHEEHYPLTENFARSDVAVQENDELNFIVEERKRRQTRSEEKELPDEKECPQEKKCPHKCPKEKKCPRKCPQDKKCCSLKIRRE
jgi:hypothetical protein